MFLDYNTTRVVNCQALLVSTPVVLAGLTPSTAPRILVLLDFNGAVGDYDVTFILSSTGKAAGAPLTALPVGTRVVTQKSVKDVADQSVSEHHVLSATGQFVVNVTNDAALELKLPTRVMNESASFQISLAVDAVCNAAVVIFDQGLQA